VELPTPTEDLQYEFDTLENDFKRLELQILYIIRNEVRCHTIYYLDLAIREVRQKVPISSETHPLFPSYPPLQGNYVTEELHAEPDPYISLLNTDLTEMEEIISNSLPPRYARFVFDGITGLMSSVLIHNIRQLRQVTLSGVDRYDLIL
jgi:exocyst complex component 4